MQGCFQGSSYPGHSSRDTEAVSRKHPLNCGVSARSLACRGGATAPPKSRSRGVRATSSSSTTRAEARAAAKARRADIVRRGDVPATVPVWTSRDGWITSVAAWTATDDGRAECRRAKIRPATVLRIAAALARFADHGTGRHCAVSNTTVAAAAGIRGNDGRTVTTVRSVLSAGRLAMEAARGYGASRRGGQPSIWHLFNRPRPAAAEAFCDLPTSRRDSRLRPVGRNSPSAPRRTRKPKSTTCGASRRFAPRPLHVQRLAAELVHRCLGLDQGHIGRICDALQVSGLELESWTGLQLKEALDADMRERRTSWPDRIDRAAAFLLTRLRGLPTRPPQTSRPGNVVARPISRTLVAEPPRLDCDTARWRTDVFAATTPDARDRILQAHFAKFGHVPDPVRALAGAGRNASRMFPKLPLTAALHAWASEILDSRPDRRSGPATSLSVDLLLAAAATDGDCTVCGSGNATARPELPLRSAVCDRCWPVISAELSTDDLGTSSEYLDTREWA